MVIITSFSQPETPIKLEQRNVRAVLDKKDLGTGTLFVSESSLCWQEINDRGFSIGYTSITLHAISKDVNVYPTECIYILIDSHISLPQIQDSNTDAADNSEDGEDKFSDAESEPDVSELILVPENSGFVPAIYEAIKLCQELNPDPIDVEDDEDDNIYADAEDMQEEYEDDDIRAGGDIIINDLADRFQNSLAEHQNGNDEDEFEDAD